MAKEMPIILQCALVMGKIKRPGYYVVVYVNHAFQNTRVHLISTPVYPKRKLPIYLPICVKEMALGGQLDLSLIIKRLLLDIIF